MPKHSKAQKGDLIPAQSDKIGATPKTSTNSRVSTLNKSRKSRPVPAKMQPNYDAITALTDAFCREHLDKHYLVIAQHMTAALCRTNPSPLASGLPRTWACGIIYVIGQINFLTDPSTRPYMPTADLCSLFGVGQSTVSAKARLISNILDTSRMNPEWSLPSMLDRNPLVWIVEVNGWLVDLRDMPRNVQQIAFEQGMIPYIPADQEKKDTK